MAFLQYHQVNTKNYVKNNSSLDPPHRSRCERAVGECGNLLPPCLCMPDCCRCERAAVGWEIALSLRSSQRLSRCRCERAVGECGNLLHKQMESYRSSHFGFVFSINSIFFFLGPALICFSLDIAQYISR